MEKKKKIERYIANSFCLVSRPNSSFTLDEEYRESVLEIASEFGKYLVQENLVKSLPNYSVEIIYAFDKTSAALSFGDEICLIINRYFIQSLNNLNKIFFHELDEKYNSLPMFCYLFRLMKEQAYVSDFYEYAIFIEQFIKLKSDREIEEIWKNPKNIQHVLLTPIHEVFVVAHEISHILIDEGYLTNYKFNEKNKSTSEILSLLKKSNFNSLPLFSELLSNQDSDFNDELLCDQIAFNFLHNYFSNKLSYAQIHGAVRVFFMHMRILEIFASAFKEGQEAVNIDIKGSEVAPSMSRNWGRALEAKLSLANDSDNTVESLKIWNEYIDRHHDRITGITLNTVRRKDYRIWTANLEFNFKTLKYAISKPN